MAISIYCTFYAARENYEYSIEQYTPNTFLKYLILRYIFSKVGRPTYLQTTAIFFL